jgi:group I intron endonuclease
MNKIKKFEFYFIYMTKNLINGKRYVGWHATNDIYDGYVGSGIALKKSIKKYGKQNFITGIIEFYPEDSILEKEIYWIFQLNTLSPNGYNLTIGGDGGPIRLGMKSSKEACEKISKANKYRKHTEQSRKNMSNGKQGKKLSETHKLHIGISRLGYKFSEESIEKISSSNKNKKRSTTTRERMRSARLGKKFNKELNRFV